MTGTGTDLAVHDPATLTAKIRYAEFLAQSGLLPASYRKQPANILFAAEYGELLGLHPIAAITGINIIDGKPSISAGMISALVRRAGHRLRVTGDATHATCHIIRADDPGYTYTSDWDMDRAKTAGLLGKTNWQRYPAAMLKARAVSECARDACQEVLLGIAYTPDELGGEDDGGEVVHDGWPALPDGSVNASQMSEQAKETAGLMPRHQRVEHAGLRNMNKIDPGDVEILDGTPEDDPWLLPPPAAAAKPAPAPDSWQEGLSRLLKPLPLGTDDDKQELLAWLTGRPVNLGDPQFTREEIKLVGGVVKDHLERAEGDTEVAAARLWDQYHATHIEPAGEPVT